MRALLLLLLLVIAITPASAAEPVHPELAGASGEPMRPLPLINVGARQFYAYGADLLEWSGEAIVARTRLPARVVAIAPRDARSLHVTLGPKSEFGVAKDLVDVVVPLDGPLPFRGFWTGGSTDAYLTLREARAIASGFEPERKDLDEAKRKTLLDALLAREALDRTNAFLPFFRGQVHARAGNADAATRAFDAAANLEHAPFNDLLRLSQMLEDEEQPVLAQRAFERGMAAMRAGGPRPERLQSQVAYQVLMGVPRQALSSALARFDAPRVDAIEERVAVAFPRLEGANLAWRDLAAWMRARGREDLAAKWASRADVAAASVPNMPVAASLDRLLPCIIGMSVIAPLVAFVVGLRRGSRRSDSNLRIAIDLFSAFSALLATVALIAWANARLEVVARRAYAPIALFDDGGASPDVARFVNQRLAPGQERDQVLQWIARESTAARDGVRNDAPPPDDATIKRAFERANVRVAVADALGQRSWLPQNERVLGLRHTALLAGLLFVAGYFLGTRAPRAAEAASRVVPGGPASLPVIGPLLAGGFLGGVFSFAFGDRLFSSIATPNNARFFGFESIASAPTIAPDRTWAIALIVGYAVVHLIGVRLDSRQ